MPNTSIGAVELELIANLVKFKLGMAEAGKEASRGTRKIKESFQNDSRDAKDALDLLGDTAGIRIPRELKKIIASTPGVSAALAAAFSSAAIVSFIGVAAQLLPYIKKIIDGINEIPGAEERAARSQALLTHIKLLNDQAVELARNLRLAGLSGKARSEEENRINQEEKESGEERIKRITAEIAALEKRSKATQRITQYTGSTAVTTIIPTNDAKLAAEELKVKYLELDDTVGAVVASQYKIGIAGKEAAAVAGQETVEATKKLKEHLQTQREVSRSLLSAFPTANLDAFDQAVLKTQEQLEKLADARSKGVFDDIQAGILRAKIEVQGFQAQLAALVAEVKKLPVEQRSAPSLGEPGIARPDQAGVESKQAELLRKLNADTLEGADARTKAAQDVIASLETENDKYRDQIAILDTLHAKGVLNDADYEKAKNAIDLNSIAIRSFGGELADTIKTGVLFGSSWKQTLESLAISFTQLILKLTLFKNLSATAGGGGGGIGGFFGSLLGGLAGIKPKAGGGDVRAWETVNVGEHGTERFTPRVAGRITPASDLKGDGKVVNQHFTMNVSGVQDVDSFRKSQSQISADMLAMMSNAAKRNR